MVKLENLVPDAEGYLVDTTTGERVIFYTCDPEKNHLCTRSMCRAMTGGEDQTEIGFCATTPDSAFRKDGTPAFYKRLNADGYFGREYIPEEGHADDD